MCYDFGYGVVILEDDYKEGFENVLLGLGENQEGILPTSTIVEDYLPFCEEEGMTPFTAEANREFFDAMDDIEAFLAANLNKMFAGGKDMFHSNWGYLFVPVRFPETDHYKPEAPTEADINVALRTLLSPILENPVEIGYMAIEE